MKGVLEQEGGQLQEEGRVQQLIRTLKERSRGLWLVAADEAMRDWLLIRREPDLFIGIAFLVVGLLGFDSGRYCDGSSSEYISCTRPATFYFFSPFDTLFVIAGAFFIALWTQKRKKSK